MTGGFRTGGHGHRSSMDLNRPSVIVALLTPFDDNGDLDEAALGAHVDYLVAAGVDALMPCGTTGEAAASLRRGARGHGARDLCRRRRAGSGARPRGAPRHRADAGARAAGRRARRGRRVRRRALLLPGRRRPDPRALRRARRGARGHAPVRLHDPRAHPQRARSGPGRRADRGRARGPEGLDQVDRTASRVCRRGARRRRRLRALHGQHVPGARGRADGGRRGGACGRERLARAVRGARTRRA